MTTKRVPLTTKRLIAALMLLAAAGAGGCAHSTPRRVINEALATENPARPEALAGPPPVRPEALAIVPTGLPATDAPAIAPQAILPGMDEAVKKRRLPAGIMPGPTATQPMDRVRPHEQNPSEPDLRGGQKP